MRRWLDVMAIAWLALEISLCQIFFFVVVWIVLMIFSACVLRLMYGRDLSYLSVIIYLLLPLQLLLEFIPKKHLKMLILQFYILAEKSAGFDSLLLKGGGEDEDA